MIKKSKSIFNDVQQKKENVKIIKSNDDDVDEKRYFL